MLRNTQRQTGTLCPPAQRNWFEALLWWKFQMLTFSGPVSHILQQYCLHVLAGAAH